MRPVPDDTVGSLRGAHAGPGPTCEQARRAERESDADDRRRGSLGLTVLDAYVVLAYPLEDSSGVRP